jgi:IMP cyclohydrolase
MVDPSLIIYWPVRSIDNSIIITNGDQTDTIYDGLDRQMTFEQSLRTREFEPDAPNYTPRISGVLHVEAGKYNFAMSILKSDDGDPSACLRQTFAYENPAAGQGRFISTYQGDGNPLPSFAGEPVKLAFDDSFTADIDTFANRIWDALNEDNKVSLFVRFIDISTGEAESRIINKNK